MLSHIPGYPTYHGNSSAPSHSHQASNDRALHSNLFAKCHTFIPPTELVTSNVNANITNCQYIGSYNWVSDHNDTSIIVPGSPREWQEQPLPYTVPPDVLGHYRQQYDRRMRSTPLLPLLLSVNHWHERTYPQPSKYPWHAIDFVTNRNSLRHLLRILRTDNGEDNGKGACRGKNYRCDNPYSKPFRIDIELAGNKTILFNRWEPTDSEPLYINTYGFNFESAFTREAEAVSGLDPSGQTARHHRINSYDFGGLQMVVRSEIDACLPPTDPLFKDGELGLNIDIAPLQTSSADTALNPFGLRVIPSSNPPTPQSQLIELSTIKSSTFPSWNAKERYPQLYFSQVPNHYLGCHVQGTINQINKRDLNKSPEMLFYAPIIEPKLRMLRKLLEMIQTAVITQAYRSRGTRKCFSLVYFHGRLSLFERIGDRCLPNEAFAMFDA